MMRPLIAGIFGCVAWLGARDAFAEARPLHVVAVTEPACALRLVDMDQYAESLQVELGAEGGRLFSGSHVESGAATQTVAVEVAPCDSKATSVDVVVTDALTGKNAHRTVPVWDLSAVTRARAVAMVTAEMIQRAEWTTELPAQPASSTPPPSVRALPPATTSSLPPARPTHELVTAERLPAPPARTPAPSVAPAAATTPSRVTVDVAFEYRVFPADQTPMFGGRLGGRLRSAKAPYELSADVGAASGSKTDPLGIVHVFSATAGIGVSHLSDLGGVVVAIGPVLDVGVGHVAGDATGNAQPGSQNQFVAAAALDVGARIDAFSGTCLTLDLLGGYSLSGLRGFADDRRVVGMSGALAVARIGLMQLR